MHIYNATSKPFREIVFGLSKPEVKINMAVSAVKLVKEPCREPGTEWVLEVQPETFTATELDFALEVYNAVTETWGATPDKRSSSTLPTTVEWRRRMFYADQIEWMHRHLARRDSIPHQPAPAQRPRHGGRRRRTRIDGWCRPRRGAACSATANAPATSTSSRWLESLHAGCFPNLGFRISTRLPAALNIARSCRFIHAIPMLATSCFTAFSGSHQDAIKKTLQHKMPTAPWNLPYLPIDPADLGRNYDSVIRINSQSGKGGVAYLLETEYGSSCRAVCRSNSRRSSSATPTSTAARLRPQRISGRSSPATYLDNAEPYRLRRTPSVEDGKAREFV